MSGTIDLKKFGNGEELARLIDSLAKDSIIDPKAAGSIKAKITELSEDLARPAGGKLRVTCAGIYNSGKSSLLNALTGGEHFKVGDVPTTSSIDEFEYCGVVYVDTPGLNANNFDNETAQRAFKDADVIIFVSNMQNGGLNAAEAEYLKELSRILGGKDNLKKQTLFVMSNLHQIDEGSAQKIVDEHKKNIQAALEFTPDDVIITYDAVTYDEGTKTNELALIDASGVNRLRQELGKKITQTKNASGELRDKRILEKQAALAESLTDALKPIKSRISKLEASVAGKTIDKAAVEKIIKECKSSIESMTGALNPPEFSDGYDVLLDSIRLGMTYSFRGESSESAAKRRLREIVSRAYNKRESVLKDAASRMADFMLGYTVYNSSSGNYYYDINKKATDAVFKCNELFRKVGISLPSSAIAQINIIPKTSNISKSELRNIIMDDVIEYGGYYSLDSYMDYCDIEEEFKDFGRFGREIYTYGCYNCSKAADEMIKDMASSFKSNLRSAWNQATRGAGDFCSKVKSELNSRLDAIIKAAEAALKNSGGNSKAELDKLKNAVAPIEKYFA